MVTVSISCVDSCLAWSCSKGGSLPENRSQPAQSHSHAAELWIIPLFILAAGSIFAMLFLLSFPLCRVQQLSTSFQPPVFVCQVSAGEIRYLSNSPCKVCVCEDSGRCSVPRSLPAARTIALGRVHRCLPFVMLCSLQKETRECLGLDLKIKLCVSDAGDGAWISEMKLPGASSGRSRGWSLWSQLSPASFIRTLCPGGEKLKHELVSPPSWNFLPGKSVVLPQTGVTAHWIIMW